MFYLVFRDYFFPCVFLGFSVVFAFCTVSLLVLLLLDTFANSRRKKRD